MHPLLQGQLAVLHQEDLQREAAAARMRREAERADRDDGSGHADSGVVIRRSTAADGPALAALAALDGTHPPLGPALVAEVDGSPRAALPLDGQPAFADPFHHTSELVALLELRAAQIGSSESESEHQRGRGRLAWIASTALRRAH